eukprot:11241755-Prorocentrum_lima.AAC.1
MCPWPDHITGRSGYVGETPDIFGPYHLLPTDFKPCARTLENAGRMRLEQRRIAVSYTHLRAHETRRHL